MKNIHIVFTLTALLTVFMPLWVVDHTAAFEAFLLLLVCLLILTLCSCSMEIIKAIKGK